MEKCPKCGVWVKNLRRHLDRKRCDMQHLRKDFRVKLKKEKKKKRQEEVMKWRAKNG
jgi:hypothetical protein